MMMASQAVFTLARRCSPRDHTMPVFLALALISGQPLNLVPDDCPNLPPYAICAAKYKESFRAWAKLEREWRRRDEYDPHRDGSPMSDAWLKDPNALHQWREQARQEAAKADKVHMFWWLARGGRHSRCIEIRCVDADGTIHYYDPRLSDQTECRQYLGEALWQKGGWWK
jgi:hypothetical protein